MAYATDFKVTAIDRIKLQKVFKLLHGKKKVILDLGCGDGVYMKYFRQAGHSVIGVDIAENAIKKARKKGFKVYDLPLDKPFASKIKERFDVAFGSEIIEHIFDTDQFLQEIRRVLKKNGELIITTPNVASLGRRILLLLGKSPLTETTARKSDAGHVRYFTHETLANLLKENGFLVKYSSSAVVNLDINGHVYSKLLASLFPQIGNTIIIKAVKV